jgi:hypothetical protein
VAAIGHEFLTITNLTGNIQSQFKSGLGEIKQGKFHGDMTCGAI